MKKIYLSLLCTGLMAGGAFAQRNVQSIHVPGEVTHKTTSAKPNAPVVTEKAIVWTEDFANGMASTNGTWTTGGTNGNVWKHSFYTTSGEWSTGTVPMASTTASNGFMLFDADSVNFPLSPNYITLTGELISPSIDLSGEPTALLKIEQDFRYCCSGTHDVFVSVSTNNGASWSAPFDLTGGTAPNDDFYTTNGDSYVQYANISSLAAGQSNVKLKFTWDGNASGSSHYYWTIDDISIESLPDDDMKNLAAWISGVNNGGIEYGRNPVDQMDADWYVGTMVYNFGGNTQTNVATADVYNGFTSNGSVASLLPDSTVIIEQTETLTLTPGMYTGAHAATSDMETAVSSTFGDNVRTREFEVTAATSGATLTQYSIDGIGVYTQNTVVSSLGTNSFSSNVPGSEDGMIFVALYNIKQSAQPVGIRVMLANGTVAGGNIYGGIMDTAIFWSATMSPLYSTDGTAAATTVTAADIAAGYKDLYFVNPPTLTPGPYYASVELYSNANANNIRVADDETVDQPGDASAIYLPFDPNNQGVYGNGTAFGIRLLFGGAGVEENSLQGVTVYPNPSEGLVTVSNENGTTNTIVVYNMVGNVVLSKVASTSTELDLTSVSSGVYMVKVSNENGSMVENVVIK